MCLMSWKEIDSEGFYLARSISISFGATTAESYTNDGFFVLVFRRMTLAGILRFRQLKPRDVAACKNKSVKTGFRRLCTHLFEAVVKLNGELRDILKDVA